MSFSLIPQYSFPSLEDISPRLLRSLGVELLMMDLDNTISPYQVDTPTPGLLNWTEQMKSSGITLYIVSNSRRDSRVRRFAEAMGVGFVSRAGKPKRRGIRSILNMLGLSPGQAALVGDQIFTDVLAANRSGVLSMLVEPILLSSPFFKLRYLVEGPIRRRSPHQIGQIR